MESELRNVIGVNEAASILSVSPGHVKNLCAEGKIVAKKIGKTWVINRTRLKGVMQMEYEQDLEKIKAVYKDRGYTITNEEAENIWGTYSDRLFASWMMIPVDINGIFEMTEDVAKELKVIIPPYQK
ncbi:hypothetical protein ACN91_15060 [Bacillus cereus]|nr:helix-turn-helix domain-containing protein [Bacillus cereus]ALC52851.1 hypothetical protein ACN91_15060 [Bacillus cereus]